MSEIPALYGQYDDEGNPLWMDGAVRRMFALRAENARLRNGASKTWALDGAHIVLNDSAGGSLSWRPPNWVLTWCGSPFAEDPFAHESCEIRAELPTETMTPLEKYGTSDG